MPIGGRGGKATGPAEWAIAIVGGLLFAAVLIWWIRSPSLPAADDSIELTAAPPGGPASAAAPSASGPIPGPPAPTAVAPLASNPAPPAVARPTAPAASASTAGLRLHGLMARPERAAAIFALPDGRQRYVVEGREVLPGVRLETVKGNGVTLLAGGSRVELGFGEAEAQAATMVAAPATAATGGPAASATLAELKASVVDYRLGLTARRSGGRVTGFTVADVASMPVFRLAGLRPGDVVVAINGQAFESEEKVIELPIEVAGANAVEIEFERDGKRQRAVVTVER